MTKVLGAGNEREGILFSIFLTIIHHHQNLKEIIVVWVFSVCSRCVFALCARAQPYL